MSPFEFGLIVRGRQEAVKAEWHRTAQLASWIMRAWIGKDAPSADELLGQERVSAVEFNSLAEAVAYGKSKE